METKEIIESGFVKAFINEYFENKIYSFYPDKDRLLYALCSSEIEEQQVTINQIEITKSKIQKLGYEELSFAYILSFKPESKWNFIEPDKRIKFWLSRFAEEFEQRLNSFSPIKNAVLLFNEVSELDVKCFESEADFWDFYPKSLKPKEQCLPFVIQREVEIINEIDYTISEYKENDWWEFDFENFEKFIETSKPIEILFNLSELLVQLSRLEMFNELPPQQTSAKTDKLKAPVLGLFCSLINKIGIDKKDEAESAIVYCERICGKFKLPYTSY